MADAIYLKISGAKPPRDNSPKPDADRRFFEIMQVPVISTAHITIEDREQLSKAEPADVLATLWDGSGHIIHAEADEPVSEAFPPGRFSDSFRQLVQWFRDRGYTYLRLDANALLVPELPTFE